MRLAVTIAALLLATACHRSLNAVGTPSPGATEPAATASAKPVSPASPAGTDLPAAAATIRLYYERLDAGDYAGAYRLWWDDGAASGTSEAAFVKGFADTKRTAVTILGPGEGEGAAGSVYATIPVSVDASLKSGEEQHFAGSYVLRRVNDVPGSSAEQRRWHVYSASLKPVSDPTKKGRG